MRTSAAVIAANRFGLGARPDDVSAIEAEPRRWVLDQLGRSADPPPSLHGLPGGEARMGDYLRAVAERRAAGAEAYLKENARRIYLEEAQGWLAAALTTAAPVRERLVHFWANHFTVSAVRPAVAPLAGPFEREAIRPHVAGRFADMLIAAARHPAMMVYLDNAVSIGPNSPLGRRAGRGLNENLAREILELHTVGVAAGYTQDDVRALACMLTGWSLSRPAEGGAAGTFLFRERAHEPGAQVLLGRRFPEGGYEQAEAALLFLAGHPATAQHIAGKLARHFAGDEPPPPLVDRLARRFRESGGDLGQVARALAEAPEPWAALTPKIRTPVELQLAAFRNLGLAPPAQRVVPALAAMGQAPFRAPSPAGWSDRAKDWLSPEAMVKRVEWAVALAERVPPAERPELLLERALGPAAGEATRAAVARAESGREAVALLLSSPEFQRR